MTVYDVIDVMNFIFISNDAWMFWLAFILAAGLVLGMKNK